MNIDKRFEQLNKMPEDEMLKQKIRRNLQTNEKKTATREGFVVWKELVLVMAICCLGLFLFVTSTFENNQAATNDIKGIYSYEVSNDSPFRGRASTLYIGVKDAMTTNTVRLFEQLEKLEPIYTSRESYSSRYDVVVVKNGEKHRYQVTMGYIYDVDNKLVYPGLQQFPSAVYSDFIEAHSHQNGILNMLVPIAVIIINVIAASYYKRRNIQVPDNLPGRAYSVLIMIATFIALGAYYFYIGPFYRPLLFVLAFIYGYLLWWPIKRNITNLNIIKVEKWKTIMMVLIVIWWIVVN